MTDDADLDLVRKNFRRVCGDLRRADGNALRPTWSSLSRVALAGVPAAWTTWLAPGDTAAAADGTMTARA